MTKIYFVGAGSGASDLITVRGARLLERADIVVWAGSLVNKDLLSYCKADCKMYDSAHMTLEDTDAVLQEAAREDKICVRLHTGDPAIFGAIREQMELLDAAGIEYEVVPGVSSMFASAAALKRELTVPEVSQTVIISRMEGRTPVPERERIRSLATHGATMVLFLSSGMISALCAELLAGGVYTAETPCAVVYKASWPDEKIIRGTLSDIAQKAAESGITKTALVLVGDFLGDRHALSRLYDKHFSTEYRAAVSCAAIDSGCKSDSVPVPPAPPAASAALEALLAFSRIALVCFSAQGEALMRTIADSCPSAVTLSCFGSEHERLSAFCAEQFSYAHSGKSTLLVFVGAAGIAVRAISPYVQSKATDAAVVCVDEGGHFAIPLLSGHLGGANTAAKSIAFLVGAVPVLTTATDVRGAWAVDSWAKEHNWLLPSLKEAKRISAAVLSGKKVLHVGMGCKRGVESEALLQFLKTTFSDCNLPLSLIGALSSIDVKQDEKALQEAAAYLKVPFLTYSADALNAAPCGNGAFSDSAFVMQTVGTGCVCERAAVLSAQSTADWLIVRKIASDGMTLAVAISLL